MTWPPRVGEPLPRAHDAFGVREKLAGYSLDLANLVGGPKAQGFKLILGITIADIDYLEEEIRAGISAQPISVVRDNSPYGINCVVEVPVRGIGAKSARIITLERFGRSRLANHGRVL